MRLYLIRHGQTAWNAELRAQGHSDIPLDEDGLQQARLLGDAFRNIRLDLVLSSDLQRAKDTAEPIARASGARLETDPLLRERGFGEWEGLNFLQISAEFERIENEEEISRYYYTPPGGESYEQVWERLDPIAERLFAMDEEVAVVTHGGTAGLLLAKLMMGNLETARSFRFKNTSVTELHLRPEKLFHLVRYNDVSHLDAGLALSGSVDGATR